MRLIKPVCILLFTLSGILFSCTAKVKPESDQNDKMGAQLENAFTLPKSWWPAGSHAEETNIGSHSSEYDMGIAKGEGEHGKNAATIKYKEGATGFGTLMQSCIPYKYLGKRVRMTGSIKSENVESFSGMWLRVDQASSLTALAFDNMQNRGITGTTGWKKYEIVLDVPTNATLLSYGVQLRGKGQVWFENISFEEVDKSIPVTGTETIGQPGFVQPEPSNLNFEE
jgi:hypothetical protein